MTEAGVPISFTSEFATIGGLRLHYVRGGAGPVVVLLHGYPQNWYEWRNVAPGALVGHDIGAMVAYAYAAQHRPSVSRLVLSEAPLPMEDFMYGAPALTAQGPGLWNFGFFSMTNGLPESIISGKETSWVRHFIDWISHDQDAVSAQDVEVYAQPLRHPARLRASVEYFRAFPTDIADVARYREQGPLPMPVLALGAQYMMGDVVAEHARRVASDITGAVIADAGHWIAEEQPGDVLTRLLGFLK